MKLNHPSHQTGKRLAAVNGGTLTSHFAKLQALVDEFGFDERRDWNLDETDCNPGRDTTGVRRAKIFTRRNDCMSLKLSEFVRLADELAMTSSSPAALISDLARSWSLLDEIAAMYRGVVFARRSGFSSALGVLMPS